MKQLSVALLLVASTAAADPPPPHPLPKAQSGGTVVGLCDGQTSIEVKDLPPGETMSRAQAQAVSDQLMAAWRRQHPGARWDRVVAQNTPPPRAIPAATPSAPPPAPAPSVSPQRGPYQSYTGRDELIWAHETFKFIEEGNHIFHDAKLLGGTIGVSCDMCHPNAANTHPETYPKFQVQLGRVALLRDMINWCLENPVKGKPLRDDDDRLRALEAYILAQRKGTRLDYGKH
jgi:thiosulfate dehydrogenase